MSVYTRVNLFKTLVLIITALVLSINIYSVKSIKSVSEGFSNRQNEATWYVFQLVKEYANFIMVSQSQPMNVAQIKLKYDITWSRFEILIKSKVSSEFVKAANFKEYFIDEFRKFKDLELSIELLEEGKLTQKDFLKRIRINYDFIIQFINNNFRLQSPAIESNTQMLDSVITIHRWSGMLLILSIFVTGGVFYSDYRRYTRLKYIDQLTGFSNRIALMKFIKEFPNDELKFKIITVRIRNLNEVNFQYGSEYGDLMIQSAASALKEMTSSKGSPFRSSGAEFIFIFSNESNVAVCLKEKFKETLSEYITVGRIELLLDVVIKYKEGVEISQILENIDRA